MPTETIPSQPEFDKALADMQAPLPKLLEWAVLPLKRKSADALARAAESAIANLRLILKKLTAGKTIRNTPIADQLTPDDERGKQHQSPHDERMDPKPADEGGLDWDSD